MRCRSLPTDSDRAPAEDLDAEDLDTGDLDAGDLVAGDGDFVAGDGDFVAGDGDFVAGDGDFVAGDGDFVAGDGDFVALFCFFGRFAIKFIPASLIPRTRSCFGGFYPISGDRCQFGSTHRTLIWVCQNGRIQPLVPGPRNHRHEAHLLKPMKLNNLQQSIQATSSCGTVFA